MLLFCCVWRPRKQRKKQEADYVQKYFENVNKGEPYPNNAAPAAAGEGWHSMLAFGPAQQCLATLLLHAAMLSWLASIVPHPCWEKVKRHYKGTSADMAG